MLKYLNIFKWNRQKVKKNNFVVSGRMGELYNCVYFRAPFISISRESGPCGSAV